MNTTRAQSLTFNVFGFAQFRLKGCLVMLSLTSLRFLKLNKDLRVQSLIKYNALCQRPRKDRRKQNEICIIAAFYFL